MTPFGIRKRIRSLLGVDAPGSSEPPTAKKPKEKVTLIVVDGAGEEQTYEGAAHMTPLYISGNMQKPIASGCNDSSCSTCRIEVLEGAENLSPRDEREKQTLAANNRSPELRLGCRAEILRGTVKVRAFEFLEV